ncbi:TOBE domain-containing protein [Mailhella sp.]|uniref:TOBE domain-containing protein n=1 Tax=Mailhella sp. TaxID=1981029 RepID=UPI003AB52D0D
MNSKDPLVADGALVLDERRLRSFLQAFYHWYEEASSPAQQCSRSRVLLICLLVRFAALRLGEVLSLDDMADIDAQKGMIHVRGKWRRDLPLPRSALNRLLELRDAPCNIRARGELCHLDPAYVRRIFAMRAEEAGLSGLSPTGLRNFREQELLRHGVPLPTVEFFLGRRKGGQAAPGELAHLREVFRLWERASQTGRHNVVNGTLTLLQRGEFSCFLTLTTQAGTTFFIRCSTRTFVRLDLGERKKASAFIRSLQVVILSEKLDERNCFEGIVDDMLERGEEARVMIRLKSDSQQFCAILSLRRARDLALSRGSSVWVMIRPADFTFCGIEESAV